MIETYERKNIRIDLTFVAYITFYNNLNRLFLVKNISFSGMFVATHLNIVTGIECLIELRSNSPDELLDREICGRVVRQSDDGFGIQFTRMNLEAYMILQARLLYSHRDPFALCEEFTDNCPVVIKAKCHSYRNSVPGLNG